jgi:predicted house-cleaning noncanonical NTP pyrophosphatase (MazG superfamily)
MKRIYNKLVRDKIPEIIHADNQTPTVRTLGRDEYLDSLVEKLKEEVEEFIQDKNTEELADIMEVIHALARCIDADPAAVEAIRQQKAESRGGFEKRMFLESVES